MKRNSALSQVVLALSLFGCLFLSACGGGGGDSDSAGDTSDAPSICLSKSGRLGLKIINGDLCSSESSPIVRINILNADGSDALCTGTVITSTHVLTAAHCFIVSNVIAANIESQSGEQFSAAQIAIHPEVGTDGTNLAVFNDVAIVRTSRAMNLPTLPIFANVAIEVGNTIGVEGFGLDENDDFGDPRGGLMTISTISPNHIFAEFDGSGSNVCNGDSGGPAYIEREIQGATRNGIIGVVSSGNPQTGCFEGDVSLFANLQNPKVLSFIETVAPNAEVL